MDPHLPELPEDPLQRLIDSGDSPPADQGLLPEVVDRLRRELEERRQAEQALRDSEARMRAIVNTAVDGIITIDERGTIESVNPATERIFGFAAEEMIGQNVKLLMPNPYRDEHDRYLHNYRQTGHRKIIGIGREVLGQRKDGTIFPIDLAVSEVHLGQRRIFTGIVRDITQRKQGEEDLRQAMEAADLAREAAEAANAAKDHFLAVLSHELRTPLTPVLATVTFVEGRSDLPDELRDEISTIRRNVEMEARLIDDLLDLTRIARGKIHLRKETLDAHASLRNALEICQDEVEAKELEISLSLRARQHHVHADPARMQQVFWNLLKNAVKFTPEGGRISIRSRNETPGTTAVSPPDAPDAPSDSDANRAASLVIEVSDTGIGIEPEALPRIFNAFEQGERTVTRQFGGLGLGLAITKALVDMHGGTLTAESPGRGRGATFILRLDAVAVLPQNRPAAISAARSAARSPAHKGLNILLVEDHEDTLRVMASLLRRYGYTVRTATCVRRALELAEREKFDLLISDLGLPDGSGLDVMRQVKAQYGVKGIALSGFGMDEDIRRSHEAGFEQHLTKPVNLQTLDNVIQRVAT